MDNLAKKENLYFIENELKVKLSKKIYSIREIKNIIMPILKKYGVKKSYIFGSYAKGNATADSDIDIMITNNNFTLFSLSGLQTELIEALKKDVDLVTVEAYEEDSIDEADKRFYQIVKKERIDINEL